MVEVEETLSETEQQPTPALPLGRLGGDDELLPTTLIDRYQIERRLGAGAMGVVHAARDIHLRRAVAVKVVGPRIDTGSGQDRLVREAQAMAKLRHPNLATVHDIGVSQDRLFVVMELVDGGTVADWLKAEPRSWRAILAVYAQAARGLAAAHAAGLVHRDFKPENVLYGKDGVARVSDFGVAHILGYAEGADPAEGVAEQATVTRTGGVVGTCGAPRLFVMPNGARSVEFRRSTIGDGAATFANDEHDFPTTITYELAADRAGLATRLGGGGKLSSFRFKRGTRSPAPDLEAADLAFAAATVQQGVDGWVAAFDPKGGMIRNARRVEYAAIAKFMTPMLSSGRLDWAPIASGKSGELGFTVGKGSFTGARPENGWRSTYVTIWRRQPDGAWKVLFDTGRIVQD